MMNKNQKIALALSIIIPVLVLLVILFLVLSPIGKANPTTDFLYSLGLSQGPTGNISFQVQNGKIVVVENKFSVDKNYSEAKRLIDGKEVGLTVPDIYYHDVLKNESRKISLDEAKSLTLDASIKSPDGFKIDRRYGSGGSVWPIPTPYYDSYTSSPYGDVYLTKNSLSKKMDTKQPVPDAYYNQDFIFIGWVVK